jgi:hypothetical protein
MQPLHRGGRRVIGEGGTRGIRVTAIAMLEESEAGKIRMGMMMVMVMIEVNVEVQMEIMLDIGMLIIVIGIVIIVGMMRTMTMIGEPNEGASAKIIMTVTPRGDRLIEILLLPLAEIAGEEAGAKTMMILMTDAATAALEMMRINVGVAGEAEATVGVTVGEVIGMRIGRIGIVTVIGIVMTETVAAVTTGAITDPPIENPKTMKMMSWSHMQCQREIARKTKGGETKGGGTKGGETGPRKQKRIGKKEKRKLSKKQNQFC